MTDSRYSRSMRRPASSPAGSNPAVDLRAASSLATSADSALALKSGSLPSNSCLPA